LGPSPRRGGERLAAELGGLEPEQLPAECRGVAVEDLESLADVPRVPLGAEEPPTPIEPAGEQRDQEPRQDAGGTAPREGGAEEEHDQGRAEADLEVAAAPEGPEA